MEVSCSCHFPVARGFGGQSGWALCCIAMAMPAGGSKLMGQGALDAAGQATGGSKLMGLGVLISWPSHPRVQVDGQAFSMAHSQGVQS